MLAQSRPYEAMWAFQDALEAHSADTEVYRGLARALIAAQFPQRALEVLAGCRGAQAPGEVGENRRVAAAAYLSMGDPLGAVALLMAIGPALRLPRQ